MGDLTQSEARELARDLLRGSIVEDATAQFLALVLRQVHDDRIKPLRAENERLRGLLARYRDETPAGHQPHMIAQEVDAALGRSK